MVSGDTSSFAATSSGRSSSLPFFPSAEVVRPSTARLRYGSTSSSTISSRNTASGSKASFDRIVQSSKFESLPIGLSPELAGRLTVCSCSAGLCEPTHSSRQFTVIMLNMLIRQVICVRNALFYCQYTLSTRYTYSLRSTAVQRQRIHEQ